MGEKVEKRKMKLSEFMKKRKKCEKQTKSKIADERKNVRGKN